MPDFRADPAPVAPPPITQTSNELLSILRSVSSLHLMAFFPCPILDSRATAQARVLLPLPALRNGKLWTIHLTGFRARRTLKLAGRHAYEISKHRREVRLVLKSDSKRDVNNLCVALTEKLFGTIDSLLQNKLMRCQPGAQLEQL